MTAAFRPQVYDPKGQWVGFFIDEKAAHAWVAGQPKKGKGYTVNYTSPRSREEPAVEARNGEVQQ